MQQERVGVTEEIGLRSHQEDAFIIELDYALSLGDGVSRSLFAVFDGHGGANASNFAKANFGRLLEEQLRKVTPEEALKEAFLETDRQIEAALSDGCTAAVALLEGKNLTIANAGDTRVLLINQETGMVERLSKDHTPDDPEEAKRITDLEGTINYGRIFAGGVSINISRSLGDRFAGELVSPEPAVSRRQLAPGKYRLVLECDGVWRGIYDQEAPGIIAGKNPQEASQALVERSEEGDNLTAIVVDLEI